MSMTSAGMQNRIRRSSAVIVAALLVLTGISCTHSHYYDGLFYEDIARGVVSGLDAIYNDYIAGTPTGYVDILACGPYGGIVHITGTACYDPWTDVQTADLQYDLSDVRVSFTWSSSDLDVDLTLNGVMYEHSSWSHDYSSICYDSRDLWIAGSAERDCERRGVDGITDFRANSTDSRTSADLFGWNVSW
ncbi:hypothetical protein FJY68_09185 [candidate division WOR-3 bacterium]|uniref:Uncharacterized protein n=1 Tax=candidate division WOR-3 bacterium TaxID=2052148 RepID=A0A937XJ26_UNCW3|nr:hypothetical protein [candidate division WOR-3 bacterium]